MAGVKQDQGHQHDAGCGRVSQTRGTAEGLGEEASAHGEHRQAHGQDGNPAQNMPAPAFLQRGGQPVDDGHQSVIEGWVLGLVARLSATVGLPVGQTLLLGQKLHVLDVRELVGAASKGLDNAVDERQQQVDGEQDTPGPAGRGRRQGLVRDHRLSPQRPCTCHHAGGEFGVPCHRPAFGVNWTEYRQSAKDYSAADKPLAFGSRCVL